MQVFISSTYKDLIEERQAAVETVLKADHIPAGMELFKAGDETQLTVIKRWIDESDIYMLIVGGRYGSIDSKSGLSYTHLEFQMALESGIPMFALILTEEMTMQKIYPSNSPSLKKEDFTETLPELKELHKAFIDEVAGDNRIVSFIKNIHHLQSEIIFSINNIIKNRQLAGWVRASDSQLISENATLKEKIKTLTDEINLLKNKSNTEYSSVFEAVMIPDPTVENIGGYSMNQIVDYLRHTIVRSPLPDAIKMRHGALIIRHEPSVLELLTMPVVNRKLMDGIVSQYLPKNFLNKFILTEIIPVLKHFNLIEIKPSYKGLHIDSYVLNVNGAFFLTKLLSK